MRLKIYINNTLLDVSDELNLAFTYNIADIRNPESRDASFSKTIVIPASKTNNKLFTNIYDVAKDISDLGGITGKINFNPDFNPNKRADARVTVDDLLIMEGFAQMLKINKVNYEVDSYELVIFNNVKNIFEAFGEDELTILDISEYDQDYTEANVNAYSYGNPTPSYTIGEGIIYNNIYNGINPIGYYFVHPYPSVFVKTYVDKIFAYYGYQYDSEFFNTQYFKKLCIPFVKKQYSLNQQDILNRQFNLRKIYFSNVYFGIQDTASWYNIKFANQNIDNYTNLKYREEILDVNNLYDTSVNLFDINIKQGTVHTIHFKISGVVLRVATDYLINGGNLVVEVSMRIYRLRGGFTYLLATSSHTYFVGSDMPSGTNLYTYAGENFNISVPEYSLPGDTYITTANVRTTGELTQDGDPLTVYLTILPSAGNPDYPYIESNIYNTVTNENLTLGGGILEANRLIPTGIKIKDFISSLVKCFNLQVEIDKENPKKLIIEPYNDFFGSGEEKDWTDKLDVGRIEIIPMADLITNSFRFSFQFDDDLINTDYTDTYKETYGYYEVKVNNDFATTPKEIKPIFAASPCTRRSTIRIGETNVTYLAKDEDEGRDARIRMVWYNGIETDDTLNPTVAIRYDLAPSELYYSTTTLTNNTLYGKFWKKYVDEVTDKNSKMVICYLNLTPLDIANFKFTDNIFIDGHFFRVNKIIDYNPLTEALTKVELIKINFFAPLQEDTITVYEQALSFNILEGGNDEVRDFDATSFYNLVEGGENEIRDLGATSPVGIIDGGQNLI